MQVYLSFSVPLSEVVEKQIPFISVLEKGALKHLYKGKSANSTLKSDIELPLS